MEFLKTYGIWILLGLGVWWFLRRSHGTGHGHGSSGCGMGCGTSGHQRRHEEDSPHPWDET